MKFYKFLLRFIQIFVVLVVLPRVANFVGLLGSPSAGFNIHDLIRFAFAATLGLGVISTAYFSDDAEAPVYEDEPNNSRERRRREREAVYFASMQNAAPYARRAMFLFAFLDGSFNLADAMYGASASGLLDPAAQGTVLVIVYGTATFLFGVAPTILAIVLAKVISMVDRIPADYERPATRRQIDLLRTVMGNLGLREYSSGDVVNLYGSGVRLAETSNPELPAVVRRTNRAEGEQTARIIAYLETNATPEYLPKLSEIQTALGDPIPSKSTVSVVRNEWLRSQQGAP